jgi:hypothetical protein
MSIRSNKFEIGLQSSDSTLGYTGKFIVGEGTPIKSFWLHYNTALSSSLIVYAWTTFPLLFLVLLKSINNSFLKEFSRLHTLSSSLIVCTTLEWQYMYQPIGRLNCLPLIASLPFPSLSHASSSWNPYLILPQCMFSFTHARSALPGTPADLWKGYLPW